MSPVHHHSNRKTLLSWVQKEWSSNHSPRLTQFSSFQRISWMFGQLNQALRPSLNQKCCSCLAFGSEPSNMPIHLSFVGFNSLSLTVDHPIVFRNILLHYTKYICYFTTFKLFHTYFKRISLVTSPVAAPPNFAPDVLQDPGSTCPEAINPCTVCT